MLARGRTHRLASLVEAGNQAKLFAAGQSVRSLPYEGVDMKVMRFKVIAALVVVAALMGASAGVALATSRPSSTAGFAATTPSTPAGGSVKIFATPSNGAGGTILITGAIGDYGKTLSIDKNGKTDSNGDYVKITLKKGTFEVNSTTLNAKATKAQPAFYTATCSAQFSVTGRVTLFNGTGLYQGITGTVNITETYAVILPLYTSGKNKGQCNASNNAQPLSQYSSISGTGTVSF